MLPQDNQHPESPERPLHDYIDMETYDVVAGERHRELVAQFERELIAARIDNARLVEQLESAEKERDYFRNRLPDFSKVQQDEFARAGRLQEQLEARDRWAAFTHRETQDMHHALRMFAKYPGLSDEEAAGYTALADEIWERYAAQTAVAYPAKRPS